MAHTRALAELERELARAELERKGGTLGAGAAVGVGAGVLALYGVGFALATLTAVLALVVDWWLALLIVFLVIAVLVAVLALAARELFRSAGPLKPDQAIEEARLTRQMLKETRAG